LESQNQLSKLVSYGNHKLPNTSMIFNMSSASKCPSRKRKLCKVPDLCYGVKIERYAPLYRAYTERQGVYWKSHTAKQICKDLAEVIKGHNNPIRHFRYNESGDFNSQECISKLSDIATFLMFNFKIITYGYSARGDLDFSNASFYCKSSGHCNGNHGKTVVFDPNTEDPPKGFFVCPGDCRSCTACKIAKKINVAFKKH
jgi:hypothetical protein